jgi:hypothetical protein
MNVGVHSLLAFGSRRAMNSALMFAAWAHVMVGSTLCPAQGGEQSRTIREFDVRTRTRATAGRL